MTVVDTVWRSEDITAAAARWLMSESGREVLDDLVTGEVTDSLVTASRLRDAGLDAEHAAAAQGVATASRRAWDAGHPRGSWWTPAGAEQASHPLVATWRARRFDGVDVADVTAGCGGDALALVARAGRVLAADRSPVRLPLLAANLGPDVPVIQADALAPAVHPATWWAWADPGRRVDGRRVRGLAGTQPGIPDLAALGHAGMGIAVSPAVDLDDPDRPADAELEFVQVGSQLGEATLWLGAARDTGPGERAATSATLLPEGVHRRGHPTGPDRPVVEVGAWLAVPVPALVRARLADTVAAELGLDRLARTRALFTGAGPVASPWFRMERVETVVAPRAARVRDALAGLEVRPVELVTHGMRVDVQAWWRALGSPPRGPDARVVHLARLDRSSAAVITRRDLSA